MMNFNKTQRLVISALFLAIGIILPLLTSQIKEIGDSLLPMHFVVLLCGFICGGKSGLIVGLLLPFCRSFVFGMPPMYPNAVWMSAEIATYGLLTGVLYNKFFNKQTWWLYSSLVISMIAGRIVWGICKSILLGIGNQEFGFSAFIIGGFIDAFPGIIIQLVLIPIIISILKRRCN